MPPEGTTDAGAGAIPGAGAMPGQPAPSGAPAGAIPAAGVAGTPPAPTTTPSATPPAMGAADLGDAGHRAIQAERARADAAEEARKTAEKELTTLREAGASEAEKARNQAVREAVATERATWQAGYREIVAEGALRGAGVASEKMLRLALMAPEFTKLKVTDDRKVEGVAEAVEQFKKDYPEAFGAKPEPGPGGSWGGAEGGRTTKDPASLDEAIQAHYAKT